MTGKKVLVFGTFDIFHPGHEAFLKAAKAHGDELHAVVALDSTVEKVKGRAPLNDQESRLRVLCGHRLVHSAVLGNADDKYSVIETISPDVIVLGYDQKVFVDDLAAELLARGIDAKIVRSSEAHMPHVYKSSKLRAQSE